jgi:hypothetical protein
VAFLKEGRIRLVEKPEVVKRGLKGLVIEVSAPPLSELVRLVKSLTFIKEVEIFGNRVEVLLESSKFLPQLKKALKEKFKNFSLQPKRPSLEQAFSYFEGVEEDRFL